MSFRAVAYVLPLRGFRKAEKQALLVLANYADDSLTCFPSRKTIAAMCGMSLKRTSNALEALEAAGLITVSARVSSDGRRTFDQYRINLPVHGGEE